MNAHASDTHMFGLRAITAGHNAATKGEQRVTDVHYSRTFWAWANKVTTEFSYGYHYSKKKQIA